MKRSELTRMEKVWLEVLWLLCRLIAATPYWFRYYVLEELLFVLLCYVLRYRRRVVTTNLRNSFPDREPSELHEIRRRFYRTLSEMFVDTIGLASLDNDGCRNVVRITNLGELRRETAGRDFVAFTAHYGCWEYCSFLGLHDPSFEVVAVYHPLHGPVMDALFLRLRQRDNVRVVPMKECLRFYVKNKDREPDGRSLVMGLIADQNPPLRPDSHWFRFLNQDTVFFDGGEKLALKFGMPAYYACMRRVRRGYYEMTFERIYDGEEKVPENEITRRYVRRLEEQIIARPELWMWSHRRWKHRRFPDLPENACSEPKS